jgi:hypothetical protein
MHVDSLGFSVLDKPKHPEYNSKMNFVTIGRRGGQSRSAAKRRASRDNGEFGGRPSTRSLIERVLRRPVNVHQGKKVFSLLEHLLPEEQQTFCECFSLGVFPVWHQSEELFLELAWPRFVRQPDEDSRSLRFNERKLNDEQRFVLAKFRLAAKYHLPKPRTP